MRFTIPRWSLAAIAALLPLPVLAAFMTPGALLLSMQNDTSPRDFTMEAHGHMPGYYASVWAKGSMQGSWPGDLAMNESITIDVEAPEDNLKGRAKIALRAKDGILYARLESLEGNFAQEIGDFSATLTGKQWIQVPLDPSEATAFGFDVPVNEEGQKELLAAMADAIFSVQATKVQGGTRYALALKRDFLRSLSRAAMETTPELASLAPADDAQLRDLERLILRNGKLAFTVTTDPSDKLLSSEFSLSFKIPREEIALTAKGSTKRRQGAVTVDVPADTVPLDDFLGTMEDPFGGQQDWTDAPSVDWESSEEAPATCNPSLLRKGLCGAERVHSRY